MNLLIAFLLILVYVAIFYLIIYMFGKFVKPIDPTVVNILMFVIAAVLIVVALTGHTLFFWR